MRGGWTLCLTRYNFGMDTKRLFVRITTASLLFATAAPYYLHHERREPPHVEVSPTPGETSYDVSTLAAAALGQVQTTGDFAAHRSTSL